MTDPMSTHGTVRRAEWLGALAGTLWLACIWIYWEPRVNPWIDEVFTSLTAQQGVVGAWGHALRYQSQPPIYFLMAAMAWVAEPTIRALRAVSLLGAVVTVWAMIPLGRQLRLGSRSGWLAFACACLPIVQTYALEARPYAWTTAFVALHMAAVLRLMTMPSSEPARGAIVAVVVSAVVAMLTFYYAGVIVALALITAWIMRPDRRRRIQGAGAAITVAMLPWIPVILHQLATIARNHAVGSTVHPAPPSWSLLGSYLQDGMIGAPIATRPVVMACLLIGVVGLLGRGLSRRREASAALGHVSTMLLLVCSGGTLLTLLGVRAGELLMVHPRYLVFIPPLVIAAMVGLIEREPHQRLRWLAWAGTAMTLIVFQVSAWRHTVRRPDFRPGAALVAARATAGERILIANPETALLFLRAYRGPVPVIPLPVDTNITRYDLRDLYVQDPGQVAGRIDSAVANAAGVWWVRWSFAEPGIAETDSLVSARTTAFIAQSDTTLGPLRITHFIPRVSVR